MDTCPRCGAAVPAMALHCPACGANLLDARGATPAGGGTPPRRGAGLPPPEPFDGRTIPEPPRMVINDNDASPTVPSSFDAPLDGLTLRDPGAEGLAPPELPPATMIGLNEAARAYTAGGAARLRSDPPPVGDGPGPSGADSSGEPLGGDTRPTLSGSALAALGEAPTPALRRGVLPTRGEVVEGYRIEAEVGRGGMGRVYKATHSVTGQEVALKMLLPEFVDDKRLKARFVNEAKVLAKLSHPNLVPLLGFLDTGTRAFIVMPYVEGSTLERVLNRRGRLAVDEAVRIFTGIANGVAHVHAHQMLHRDLKPSNVILTRHGEVRVTDFGIARAIGSQRLTMTGMVVGTAEYLAPEQATGEDRDDPRSDVYALGVLLYEMLTGQVPFRHPSAGEVLMRQVSAVPPPARGIRPELSVDLEAALMRSLAKAPGDRYPTMIAFRDAITKALDAPASTTAVTAKAEASASRAERSGAARAAVAAAEAPGTDEASGAGSLAWQISLGVLLGGGAAYALWYFLEA